MNNTTIQKLLEEQRDHLFDKLQRTSISGLYKKQYADIKAGRVFVFDNGEREMLTDLKRLSKDTSHDASFAAKLDAYLHLDNNSLIKYFEGEWERIFSAIKDSGKQDETQALFVEYDYYYNYHSSVTGYGIQEYPYIEEPRYISNEYDQTKETLFLDDGIRFEPAWIDCEAFSDLDYLDIGYEQENLFRLHSRVLLHRALENLRLRSRLDFLIQRSFSFYINEHDSEVMLLYRLH